MAIVLTLLVTPSLFAAQKSLKCVSGTTSGFTFEAELVGEEVDYLIPTVKGPDVVALGKDIKKVTINETHVFSSMTGTDMGEAGEQVVSIMASSSKNEFLTLLLTNERILLLTNSGVMTYDSITCETKTREIL